MLLIPQIFMPLFLAFSCLLLGRFLGRKGCYILISLGMGVGFFLCLWNFYYICFLFNIVHVRLGTYLALGTLSIDWYFIFYHLTVTMTSVVFIISTIVLVYSFTYMKQDPHIVRFLGYLCLFTFFMLFFVTSGNLLMLFMGL